MRTSEIGEEHDLFVSYSSRDRSFALKLANDLKEYGLTVWLDEWQVKPGQRLREGINDAIARCEYLLVLLSPHSIKSQWVKAELDSAMSRELEIKRTFVIPSLLGRIEDREIPLDLRGKAWLDFRDEAKYDSNLKKVIQLFPLLAEEWQKNLSRLARREMGFVFSPWSLVWPEDGRPELFAYKAPNGFDGICRIERIPQPDGRVVIVCEEIDENPGNSITNCIESLALQICVQFDIEPKRLVLIEHYLTDYAEDQDWELVTFETMPPDKVFEGPNWRPMSREDWRSLGLRPRKRRTGSGSRKGSSVSRIRR
jgi:hypothetical protein